MLVPSSKYRSCAAGLLGAALRSVMFSGAVVAESLIVALGVIVGAVSVLFESDCAAVSPTNCSAMLAGS